MSIPAAESWDVIREAALAFRQWRIRHFGCRAGQLRASTDRDSSLLSDPAQALGPTATYVEMSCRNGIRPAV